jgi:DNA-binding PadR family transcriptional regulator
MLRKVFLGFIRLHILHHAAQGPVCGVELIRELRRHGYGISPGTLYPTLHELAAQGLLRQSSRVVNGRRRKEYTVTSDGRRALQGARRYVAELSDEILGDGRG